MQIKVVRVLSIFYKKIGCLVNHTSDAPTFVYDMIFVFFVALAFLHHNTASQHSITTQHHNTTSHTLHRVIHTISRYTYHITSYYNGLSFRPII